MENVLQINIKKKIDKLDILPNGKQLMGNPVCLFIH